LAVSPANGGEGWGRRWNVHGRVSSIRRGVGHPRCAAWSNFNYVQYQL